MFQLVSFCVMTLLIWVSPFSVQAQSAGRGDGAGFISLSAGYADPTNLNGRFGWGGDLGFMFNNGVVGSLFYRNNIASEGTIDYRIDHYGLGADWSLANVLNSAWGGFRGGVRAGVSTYDRSGGAAGTDIVDTEFSLGPSIGYDIWSIGSNFSLGGEADLFFTMGPRQFSTLYVLANLKYLF